MGEKEDSIEDESLLASRRELITKYGAYSAPIVVALLCPSEAYGHTNGQVYSTSQACADDVAAGGSMHSVSMGLMGHCMLNSSGGGSTHTIINPTVP